VCLPGVAVGGCRSSKSCCTGSYSEARVDCSPEIDSDGQDFIHAPPLVSTKQQALIQSGMHP
ncbi:hypothetical protein KI387_027379, partial [Taxus chinensis]